jgi:tetratricopeptide (TPR) repeat protein
VRQTHVVPEPAYRFKHVLTQEVAYASLLEHQRRELHGRVGRAIEMLHGDRLEEHLDRLAYHFNRAEDWPRAIRYGIAASDRASFLSQFVDALHALERAQRWLTHLPDGTDRQTNLIEILLRQERLSETLGRRGRQQHLIDELITLLEPSGDERRLAEVYLRQGDLYTLLRRFDDAERALMKSLRLRTKLGDLLGERNTLRSLGLLRWHEGRNAEAIPFIEHALEIDRTTDEPLALVSDLSNLGTVLKAMGSLTEARAPATTGNGRSRAAPWGGPRRRSLGIHGPNP